jgi:hypothetical protein
VRKRMAARLRRAQPAETAPAPRPGMTVKHQSPAARTQGRPKPRRAPRLAIQDPRSGPSTRTLRVIQGGQQRYVKFILPCGMVSLKDGLFAKGLSYHT